MESTSLSIVTFKEMLDSSSFLSHKIIRFESLVVMEFFFS